MKREDVAVELPPIFDFDASRMPRFLQKLASEVPAATEPGDAA